MSQEGRESKEVDCGGKCTSDESLFEFMTRACSFSWRVRASCRAKGLRHSLQTYGLDPVSKSSSQLGGSFVLNFVLGSKRTSGADKIRTYGNAHVSMCKDPLVILYHLAVPLSWGSWI